jgi:hypothetical protein
MTLEDEQIEILNELFRMKLCELRNEMEGTTWEGRYQRLRGRFLEIERLLQNVDLALVTEGLETPV